MMKKYKILKWFLPALVMSAMTFELLPGSVIYYAKDLSAIEAFNFFTASSEAMGAPYLSAAGLVTALALILAMAASCFGKTSVYKWTSWSALAAGALASMPYIVQSEDGFLQPNVVILLLLLGAWLVAMALDKKKDAKDEKRPAGRHL